MVQLAKYGDGKFITCKITQYFLTCERRPYSKMRQSQLNYAVKAKSYNIFSKSGKISPGEISMFFFFVGCTCVVSGQVKALKNLPRMQNINAEI